jgi:hypothetical protein
MSTLSLFSPTISIIPRMIFGIILIVGWLPVIYYTEKNNKGNKEEYDLLLEKIDKNIKLTDVTDRIIFPYKYNATEQTSSTSIASKYDVKEISIGSYKVTNKDLVNNNVLIKQTIITKTKDANGKETSTTETGSLFAFTPLIDGSHMDYNDYEYLAMQNKTNSTKMKDENNENITVETNVYSIPIGKQIIKVEGLQKFQSELDITIYNYEFGPKENVINTIKNRKSSMNTIHKWGGRFLTFLMLFIGLSLLISPLTFLISLGEALPFPLSLMVLPGRILLSIYNALSFFGSLILTFIMTMFIWSLINYPIVSLLFGGLLIGLIMYFK